MRIVNCIAGNVFCQLSPDSIAEDIRCEIYNALSYKEKNFEAIKRRMAKTNPRMRHWDGVKSFFDRKQNRFLTGFIPRIRTHLATKGYTLNVRYLSQQPPEHFSTLYIPSLEGIALRDYQERTIYDFFKHRRGVAKLATGAGKTECAIAIVAKANVPTIFLTHRVNLLYQTAQRFAKRLPHMKKHIGIIGDGQFDPKHITIATVQTLHSAHKKDGDAVKAVLNQFRLLIIDEAHRSGSKQFYEMASLCTQADYRLALTATPFMKGNDEDDMWLEGISSGIITSVSAGELIEAGVLARPFFRFIHVDAEMMHPKRFSHWRDVYEFGIVKNVTRNKIIVEQTRKLIEMKKKTLIIVQEVTHGKILESAMLAMGIGVSYVDGKNTWKERERALKMLGSGKIDAIICTNIFDEGIDVGEIGGVILAAGTKSAPALFQRTGRAVRRKEEDNYAVIIDFIDNHHVKLMEHSLRRYELIRNEPGFTII